MPTIRLSESHLTVTPTARLARSLVRSHARQRIAQGETAWYRTEILSWPAWMQRLLEDWLLVSDNARTPLSAAAARTLWSGVIDRDVFLATDRVASLVERSWSELHQWCLPRPDAWPAPLMNDDARQFRRWARNWLRRLDAGGWLDPVAWQATLPDRIRAGAIPLPESISLHGFELPPTALQTRIIQALDDAGVNLTKNQPDNPPAVTTLQAARDSEDELNLAVRWARTRAEQGQHVAIVVPDLEGRQADVERVLREVLRPDSFRLEPTSDTPWHLSLGLPLHHWPLIADCLRALNTDPMRINTLAFSALLRSPWLGGWHSERNARATLDAQLRRLPGQWLSLFRIQQLLEGKVPELALRLQAWQESRPTSAERQPASAWAAQFGRELAALGLTGDHDLDSREYQVLDAWHDTMEEFATLDAVLPALGRQTALTRLHECVQGRIFREQNPGVPIEILGLYEALGDRFDALWVTGMDEANWPPPARPDPLLPHELQRGRPDATPEGMLEQARRIVQGLARTTSSMIVSWPATRGDEILGPSRILQDGGLDIHASPQQRMADAATAYPPAPMEIGQPDVQAPVWPGQKARGGASLLANQSACPFKAAATFRLDAEGLEHPTYGLDARARGTLLHDTLEYFWKQAGDSRALADDVDALVQRSVGHALDRLLDDNRLALSPALRELEAERLAARVHQWLDIERLRPPFRVVQAEQWLNLQAGELTLTGKLDRTDQLTNGRTLLVDYKTGRVSPRAWSPEARLHDPQLPLYCLNMDPPPSAIAFAGLRPDQCAWQGLAESDPGIPGIGSLSKAGRAFAGIEDWPGLLAAWRTSINDLAAAFCNGHAAVDPRDANVCGYCRLGALCRIAERMESGA